MNAVIDKLGGGDRRSLGESADAVTAVEKTPALFADLFECLFDDDPVVRMRAADAVEKVTRASPQLIQPWKRALLETVAARKEKEVRWHVAQLLPRLELTTAERETVIGILMGYLADENSIVKTFSIQALADLTGSDKSLLDRVTPLIERLTKTGTPAMRNRGRRLLKQLRQPEAPV
jgi:hypothetical protein